MANYRNVHDAKLGYPNQQVKVRKTIVLLGNPNPNPAFCGIISVGRVKSILNKQTTHNLFSLMNGTCRTVIICVLTNHSMIFSKTALPLVWYCSIDVPYRFYRNSEGLRIPELTQVSDFMATILEDCSVNPEESFLALRVCSDNVSYRQVNIVDRMVPRYVLPLTVF